MPTDIAEKASPARSDILKTGFMYEPLLEHFRAHGFNLDEPQCLWREVNGKMVGGTAFTNYTGEGGNVQMHWVGVEPRWMNRKILNQSFSFCFNQLRVKVVLGFVPKDRLAVRDAAIKVGFKLLCLIPGIDVWMIGMTREDCRWL